MVTSSVMLPGVHSPAAGFEAPFAMLDACHDRVRRTLGLLGRLVEHLGTNGADESARSAARDVLRYFDQAAPAHHEDEERHVFPRAQALGDPALSDAVQRLRAEHGQMAAAWQALRLLLLAVADGSSDAELVGSLARAQPRFEAVYLAHAELEEGVVFPAVARAMAAPELKAMGDEMARRRGVETAAA
jgi:hemerythrin-like domain-containing protein